MSFVHTWLWPANGSGGIPGDVVGSFVWALMVAIAAAIFWPPLRRAIERLFHRVFGSHPIHDEIAYVRRAVDHIIEHHPAIPSLPKESTVTDTATAARPFRTGRKPPYPPGHPRRLAIPWLHELDPETAPGTAVAFPIDLTGGIVSFPMWGNGPDPTLTIPDAAGPPSGGQGQPVGDCYFAGVANGEYLDGNPATLTADVVVGGYDAYEAQSQGVPAGQEQDEGVVMSDALAWCVTHDWTGASVPVGQGIVLAFVPVQREAAPAAMAKYRRPLLTGVNLTGCDQQDFPNWTVGPSCQPDPNEGHVVLLAKLEAPTTPGDTFGPGGPVSWTQVVNADEAWMNACPEEFWMPVTAADRDKMGADAFDQLLALMAGLPGFEGETPPATPPSPAPTPPPSPAPPTPDVPPAPASPPPAPSEGWIARLREIAARAADGVEDEIEAVAADIERHFGGEAR